MLVKIVLFIIERVMCIDIMNYIFVVSNVVRKMVIVVVELIVYCEFYIS